MRFIDPRLGSMYPPSLDLTSVTSLLRLERYRDGLTRVLFQVLLAYLFPKLSIYRLGDREYEINMSLLRLKQKMTSAVSAVVRKGRSTHIPHIFLMRVYFLPD